MLVERRPALVERVMTPDFKAPTYQRIKLDAGGSQTGYAWDPAIEGK
jgi:hypothetical protein